MISVLRKAAGILEFLGAEPGRPRALREIAAASGQKAPTCANIVKTLVACGLVDQTAPRGGYTLGPLIHRLAARAPYRGDLVRLAEPVLRRLAEETGETALLAVLRDAKRVVLVEVDGNQELQVRSDHNGSDVYASATGRLLLAHLPGPELEAVIERRGLPDAAWPEAAGRTRLQAQLAAIRRRPFATNLGKQVVGLAAPVREGGRVTAAVGLFLPAVRYRGQHRERVQAGLLAAAEEITQGLRSGCGSSGPVGAAARQRRQGRTRMNTNSENSREATKGRA